MSLNDKLWGWLGKKPEGDFTTDLSLCFKWLVPKLEDYHWILALNEYSGEYRFEITDEEITWLGEAETPALALCRAIGRLMMRRNN